MEEQHYLNLMQQILIDGVASGSRTGTDVLSIFGSKLEFSLGGTLPLLTTKKMFSKGIIEELLFFLRGETDTKLLEEKGVNIWKGNTSREYLDSVGLSNLPEGSMGKGYGYQWRNFGGVDQIANLMSGLVNDPSSRRHIVSAWNPGELNEMALPPCHMFFQMYVKNNKLSCQFYMRSVDVFLGLPFNIASYAILTYLVAEMLGMETDKLIFVGGDTHIYTNHIPQVKEQISRIPFAFPTITVPKLDLTFSATHKDFVISNYESHSSIKAEMAI